MSVEIKYIEVRNLVINNIKEVILTPQFFNKKYKTETNYLDKLNTAFVGTRVRSGVGAKYAILMFLRDFKTKQWIREELIVDSRFNITKATLTEG